MFADSTIGFNELSIRTVSLRGGTRIRSWPDNLPRLPGLFRALRELRNSRKAGLRCVGTFSRSKKESSKKNGSGINLPLRNVGLEALGIAKGAHMVMVKGVFPVYRFLPGNGLVLDPACTSTSWSAPWKCDTKKRPLVSDHQRF